MTITLHANELPVHIHLVRSLVDSQFPVYAGLPVRSLGASGSSNVLYRLGDDLLVRLPRQPGGSAGIDKEQRWLPEVRRHLPVSVPEIVAVGNPASGYPERWSIVRWLHGELPVVCDSGALPDYDRSQLAVDLAEVINALRALAVPDSAAIDPALRGYRGRSLGEYDRHLRRTVEDCRRLPGFDLDIQAILSIWSDALELPGASEPGPDHWYHSDLVAENLLLVNGRLSSVLDFGGLAVGDPTIDLHGAWELFDPPARQVFRQRLDVDDAQWLRGRAWALAISIVALSYYWTTMPGRQRDRLAMARSVLTDVVDQAD